MRTCAASLASRCAGSTIKSGSAAAAALRSITTAGAIRFAGGIVSVALSGRSRPATQHRRIEMRAGVCSFFAYSFQYHATLPSSWRLASRLEKPAPSPKCGRKSSERVGRERLLEIDHANRGR